MGFSLSFKVKLFISFLFVSLITLVVGGTGYFTISYLTNHMSTLLRDDVELLVNAERLHSYGLTHRRYEKDFFLNIGNPKKQAGYADKFRDVSSKTIQLMSEVEEEMEGNTSLSPEIKNTLRVSREAYSKYV